MKTVDSMDCDHFSIFQCMYILLAHLSRRLIGELIVYPWSGVRRRPSVRPQCSNIFSETAWPIKAKFYVEPPWVGGTIFCSWHLGHTTKMAATPIYGKNPSKIFFSRTGGPISTKLGILNTLYFPTENAKKQIHSLISIGRYSRKIRIIQVNLKASLFW